jgi:hypothetical protein
MVSPFAAVGPHLQRAAIYSRVPARRFGFHGKVVSQLGRMWSNRFEVCYEQGSEE